MKYLTISELRSKNETDIHKHLKSLREELQKQEFDNRSQAPKDIHALRKLKVQIAQTLSVLNEQPSAKKEEK